MPTNPTTPLDPKRLGKILHGSAEVGAEGVVTVDVDRRNPIIIDHVHASHEFNIFTEVMFKPVSSDGSVTDVGPDFSMTGKEVQPVVATMRAMRWFVGCLYHQETQEHPQLYFSHMLKTGDPYALAAVVRKGLDKTNSD